jgi:hypothetical protein
MCVQAATTAKPALSGADELLADLDDDDDDEVDNSTTTAAAVQQQAVATEWISSDAINFAQYT